MPAKGFITGNGPADQLMEALRRDDERMQKFSSGRFHLGAVVTTVELALPRILAAERNRTIASLRGRIGRMPGTPQGVEILNLLDEMEAAPSSKESGETVA